MSKNNLLKCSNCKWLRIYTGKPTEIADLIETTTCGHCRGRTFRCPKCGHTAKMIKIK